MRIFIPLFVLLFITGCGSVKNNPDNASAKKNSPTTSIADISIEGMACQAGCADVIQLNLSELKGVKVAEVNFDKGLATIEFDPSMVSSKEIQKTITDTKVKEYIYTIKDVKISKSTVQ